jgi:peptidoglycan/xylan/chitin deacetylase (PgdA/CDA1 family)
VYHGPAGRQAIALTFDDGPSEWTPAILDLLRDANAQATFFVVGEAVEGREEILRRIVDEGHELGNHTYSHLDPTTLDDDALRVELVRTAERIRSATGVSPASVRPPYCADPWRVAQIADEAGCGRTILRSVDPADWRNADAALVAHHVIDQAAPGAIVCLHDGVPRTNRGVSGRQHTVDAVALILAALADRGFEVVTVSKLLA